MTSTHPGSGSNLYQGNLHHHGIIPDRPLDWITPQPYPPIYFPYPGGGDRPSDDVMDKLADLLRAIAELIDGAGGENRAPPRQGPGRGDDWSRGDDGRSHADPDDPVVAGSGRIYGDPHFIGQDGDRYDVQGEAGKTYNLLSDQGFQMNGRFDAWGDKGATAVGAVGIVAGGDEVTVNKDGSVFVNGRELADGEEVRLADGGYVKKDGNDITVVAGEYKVEFEAKGRGDNAHLNMDVSTDDANSDGVLPHGLLGQTFDVDDDARRGDSGNGAQGGGAIERANGEISERGDKTTVEMYETAGLHDTEFGGFNMFHRGGYEAPERNTGPSQQEVMELIMTAFATLAQSMMSGESSAFQSSGGEDLWS